MVWVKDPISPFFCMTSFTECLCTCVFLHLLIYMAESGLSCGTWDLLLQLMDSLVAALRLSCSTATHVGDPSSPTRDQTCVPCIARQTVNQWTTREVPWILSNATNDKAKCFYLRSASKVLFYPLICLYFFFIFLFIFISLRLITLQYCDLSILMWTSCTF